MSFQIQRKRHVYSGFGKLHYANPVTAKEWSSQRLLKHVCTAKEMIECRCEIWKMRGSTVDKKNPTKAVLTDPTALARERRSVGIATRKTML